MRASHRFDPNRPRENRFTVGVKPATFLKALPHSVRPSVVARSFGYKEGAFHNWIKSGRFPFAAYLALLDHYGRDEQGKLTMEIAPFKVERVAIIGLPLRPYTAITELAKHGPPLPLALVGGSSAKPQANGTPATLRVANGVAHGVARTKRKYTKHKTALARIPAMNAAEMMETVQARAAHHVRNGMNGNGNGHGLSVGGDHFALALDIPKSFAGARLEVKITPSR